MIDCRFSLERLNKCNEGNMARGLGIEFTEIAPDYLSAKMPINDNTTQPIGLLNGGASAAMAEIVGGLASYLSVERSKFYTVGLEIKCNHIRSAIAGFVFAKASPIHLGQRTQVWMIRITNDNDKLLCISTLTVQVMSLDENPMAKDLLAKSPLSDLS